MTYALSSEKDTYKVQLTDYNINSYRVCVVYLLFFFWFLWHIAAVENWFQIQLDSIIS